MFADNHAGRRHQHDPQATKLMLWFWIAPAHRWQGIGEPLIPSGSSCSVAMGTGSTDIERARSWAPWTVVDNFESARRKLIDAASRQRYRRPA